LRDETATRHPAPETRPGASVERWPDELPQRLEELIQLVVVLPEFRCRLALELLQPLLQRRVGASNAPQLDERPHDRNVHGDGSVASENT
jgi:hypothetical protein